MKFGVFSVSMPEYTVEDTVKVLAELGYDGVEWRVTAPSVEKPTEIPYASRYWAYNLSTLDVADIENEAIHAKALCDAYELDIFSLTTYLHPDQPAEIEPVLRAAKTIGCPKIRVFPPDYHTHQSPENYCSLLNRTLEDLAALEKRAKAYGVKIMLEIHMNNLIASPSAAYRVVSHFDPKLIGVIFDPGNMVHEGFEDYRKSFELLGDYISHIHVKNGLIVQNGQDEFGALQWKAQHAPLKSGMADLRYLFEIMHEFGYDGTVSIEDFSNEETTYDKIKNGLAYLKELYSATNK